MRHQTACLGLALVVALAVPTRAAEPPLNTDEQKTFYALGVVFAQQLIQFNLNESELELVKLGLVDGVLNHDKRVDMTKYVPRLTELQRTRTAALAASEKKAGQAFLDKAAAEKGAKKLPSGLVLVLEHAGTGATPQPTDKVKVHYSGKFTDGTVFDSSAQRNEPAVLPLSGVIPCWKEALQQLKVGAKAKLVCPSDLAYGDRGALPRIKPGATLVFEVELIDIVK